MSGLAPDNLDMWDDFADGQSQGAEERLDRHYSRRDKMTDEVFEAQVVDDDSFRPSALDPITMAEVDVAISTAKRYRRNLASFKDDVKTMATMDQETAEGCFFSLKRGNKVIQGPTVRFAEMCVSAWGNIRAGARILGETEDGRYVRAMGVCHDLEKNVYIAMESQRRITDRDGRKYNDDMIGVTANAAAAIALRNAVFKVVPRAMVQQAYLAAVNTAQGKTSSLTDRRNDVIERLQKLSPHITLEAILAAVEQPSVDNITAENLTHLIGLGTAIKDGEETVEDAFPSLKEKPEEKGQPMKPAELKKLLKMAEENGVSVKRFEEIVAEVSGGVEADECPAIHKDAIEVRLLAEGSK